MTLLVARLGLSFVNSSLRYICNDVARTRAAIWERPSDGSSVSLRILNMRGYCIPIDYIAKKACIYLMFVSRCQLVVFSGDLSKFSCKISTNLASQMRYCPTSREKIRWISSKICFLCNYLPLRIRMEGAYNYCWWSSLVNTVPLFVCLFVCLLVCLFVCLFVCFLVCLFYFFVCLFASLFVC